MHGRDLLLAGARFYRARQAEYLFEPSAGTKSGAVERLTLGAGKPSLAFHRLMNSGYKKEAAFLPSLLSVYTSICLDIFKKSLTSPTLCTFLRSQTHFRCHLSSHLSPNSVVNINIHSSLHIIIDASSHQPTTTLPSTSSSPSI